MASKISVKEPQVARRWLDSVRRIDEDYRTAMRDAASSIEGMGEFMEGTAVDEFVNAGNNLLTAADATFTAMDQIADTVNTILDTIGQFTEGVVSGITGIAKAIFG